MPMRLVPLLFVTIFLLIYLAPRGLTHGGTAASEDRDQAAIRAVLTEQQIAWNRGDTVAFLQGYWNSPQLTFASSSGFVHGWEPVASRYKAAYPDRVAMGQLDFSDLEIRSLGADVGLVLGNWRLRRTSGEIGGIFSLVFQRFPEGWRIVHDHTTVIGSPHS
jgi:ketosteroid isomerase-like protein